jgi:hypothetical protein
MNYFQAMKPVACLFFSALYISGVIAQKSQPPTTQPHAAVPAPIPIAPTKSSIKPYSEIITDKALTEKGLFIVHKVDEKWYFEIADSLFDKEILVVTRFNKSPAGSHVYGGEKVNEQTIRFEKGPAANIFLRILTLVSVASDSTQPIATAVRNSNVYPIAANFDIKAYGKDSSSVVIDMTDFFKYDNQPVTLSQDIKKKYNLGSLASDRSYISYIHSFPVNTEVRTVKTFNSSYQSSSFGFGSSVNLPAAEAAGAVTMELNNSFILLPSIPMRKRLADPRVGYLTSEYTEYNDDQQKVKTSSFIHRWRLEPKDADSLSWKNGALTEPKKPIIIYIDPATPKQWRPYLIAGINDWQSAFQEAGFKNAIVGQEWPENDSSMSLEDARYSVLRYYASDIENASGASEADPRTGEILESHIGWYHNILKMLHDWYFIQASAVDPRARSMKFDDSLMGALVRFAAEHEVGHALGLAHNMGSSSQTPVEKLRDKIWVKANGHTASVMDYARFNYVAQPEDKIGPEGLYPRIGPYDKWAIYWGYKMIPRSANAEEEKKVTERWIIDSLRKNPRLWYGGDSRNSDPRAQTEDLGDNNIKASEYGILNLKRIILQLPSWTREEGDTYDNLTDMYTQLTGQFTRYMYHVTKNVGGIYETLKSVEESGDVYQPTPKTIQKQAVAFLRKQLFETPYWLLNRDILNKISSPSSAEIVSNIQSGILISLMSSARLFRMEMMSDRFGKAVVYTPEELLNDLEKGTFQELGKSSAIDPYRRNLQKQYTDQLIGLINPAQPLATTGLPRGLIIFFGADIKNTDIPSIARGHLISLQIRIINSAKLSRDKMSRYHLNDLAERIRQALKPH